MWSTVLVIIEDCAHRSAVTHVITTLQKRIHLKTTVQRILPDVVISVVIGRGSAIAISHCPQHHLGLASLWERIDRIILSVAITDPVGTMTTVVIIGFDPRYHQGPVRILSRTVGKYQASVARFGHAPTATTHVFDGRPEAVGIFN